MRCRFWLKVVALVLACAWKMGCSSEREPPQAAASSETAEESAAKYLGLVRAEDWKGAWLRLTENRKAFWASLARGLNGESKTGLSDLAVNSARVRLRLRKAPGGQRELFELLAGELELGRAPGLRALPPYSLEATSEEEREGYARVQMPSEGIDLRMQCVGNMWLVDSVALTDHHSDEGIEGRSEEIEILVCYEATVQLPVVPTTRLNLLHRRPSTAVRVRVDSNGAVYSANRFVPSGLVGAFLSSEADLAREGHPPFSSMVVFSLEMASRLKWGDAFQVLSKMAEAGCRDVVVGVEALPGEEPRGLRVLLEGPELAREIRITSEERLLSDSFSARGISRVADSLRAWAHLNRSPQVSLPPEAAWRDAVQAFHAAAQAAGKRPLFIVSPLSRAGQRDHPELAAIMVTGWRTEPADESDEVARVHLILLE